MKGRARGGQNALEKVNPYHTRARATLSPAPCSNGPASHNSTSNPVEIITDIQTFYNDNNDVTPLSDKNSPQVDDDLKKSTNSVNITEFALMLQQDMEEEVDSALETGFVHVNGHRVKMEYAPLIRAIFERYGDITIGSRIKSPAFLSLHLDYLCVIYNKLKATKFSDVSLVELEKMRDEVGDLEGQKLNVGWLRERVESIIKKRVDLGKYLVLKEQESQRETSFKRLEKEFLLLQQQMCAVQEQMDVEKMKSDEAKKEATEIRGRIVDHVTTHSLVHNLL